MKDKNIKESSKLSVRMVEPEATERLKKRARDLGLIVNAGAADGKEARPAGKKKDN
ncbi:MAG: hypothetical protein WKF74_16860 [Pyrinomonadaceae bacterium]